MRDVTAAPPPMNCPLWEDEKRVKLWTVATLEREESEEWEAQKKEMEKASPEHGAPVKVTWEDLGAPGFSYDRWRTIAFERAEEGDFDVLMQFVAFRPDQVRIDSTFEQRKILTAIIAGKLKRRKRPRFWAPYPSEKAVEFELLAAKALRIKSLLKRSYGQAKGINERVAFIMELKGSARRKMLRHLEKGQSHRSRKVPRNK